MTTVHVVDSGEVVQTPPLAYRSAELAKLIGASSSWVNSTRALDARRLERGEAIVGPRWMRLGFGVVYLRSDVEAWIAARGVPCGVMVEKARRGAK